MGKYWRGDSTSYGRGHRISPLAVLLWMGLGAAIAILTLPLFPSSAQEFIEKGQGKVVELKESISNGRSIGVADSSDKVLVGDAVANSDINEIDALKLVEEFVSKFNKYDENALKKLTTRSYFPQVRSAIFAFKESNGQIHILQMEQLGQCDEKCFIRATLKLSGKLSLWESDLSANEIIAEFIVERVEGKLLLSNNFD